MSADGCEYGRASRDLQKQMLDLFENHVASLDKKIDRLTDKFDALTSKMFWFALGIIGTVGTGVILAALK